jgi:hypothetical protein
MKKISAKDIATTAALLAICLVSQIFKNLSVFITGPIINACIILAVLLVGLSCGIILSIITPITAFFIAASPVMTAVPGIVPLIMAGNMVLAVSVHFLLRKDLTGGKNLFQKWIIYPKAAVCAILKGAVMGLTISLWLLPTYIPTESPLRGKLPVFQKTFSLVQILTAAIGFLYVFVIMAAWKSDSKDA